MTTTSSIGTPTPVGGWPLRDTLALIGRSLRRATRTADTMIMAVALPVLIMAMFVFVFGGAIDTGMQYVDYVVPGIIMLAAAFGSATTAVVVASDMTGGLMSRFRTLPMHPSAVLTGHVVEGLARNALSMALVVAVALAAGFRPTAGAGGWLATVALLGLYVLALTWVAVCIGLVASGPEAASGGAFGIAFLPYISSAFVQPETMPRVLEVVARYQPVTPLTDTTRAWLTGAGTARPWVAIAWWLGVALAARLVAVVLFRRKAR
jgi:ABC-2 type transport system permease protein